MREARTHLAVATGTGGSENPRLLMWGMGGAAAALPKLQQLGGHARERLHRLEGPRSPFVSRGHHYLHAGLAHPFSSFQCGVQARETSFTAIFVFVGLKAIVSRLSVNGSLAAASDAVSVLNCASRSVSCC